jgi:histone H3/H4
MSETWRRCSTCKKSIDLGSTYLVCNVSTCNRARTGLLFCSMPCWDAHLPTARHREAWAEERTAPKTSEEDKQPGQKAAKPGRRRVVPTRRRDRGLPREVLIVASKLKTYVKAAGQLNTSDAVMEVLSDKLRDICDEAIERAKADGRKTLLDRDFSR